MKESDAFIMKECDKLMTNACLRSKSCKGCPECGADMREGTK